MSPEQDGDDDISNTGDPDVEENETASQTSVENSDPNTPDDHTASSPVGQGEAAGVKKAVPWVDYVPKQDLKHADDLSTRICERFDILEQNLLEKEFRLFDYVSQIGDSRYYRDFADDVNKHFRVLVKFKKRKVGGDEVIRCKRNLSLRYLPGLAPQENENFQLVTDEVSEDGIVEPANTDTASSGDQNITDSGVDESEDEVKAAAGSEDSEVETETSETATEANDNIES